jgi:glycosyltransferase involved in cell wall biosynthesis
MRVAILNEAWPAEALTPEAALARMPTLTGWVDAVLAAGAASVTVYQRFPATSEAVRGGGEYRFGDDTALVRALIASKPTVVHVNGLEFPKTTERLRRLLPASCPVIVQDHGGFDPTRVQFLQSRKLRAVLRSTDVLLVATEAQVATFRSRDFVPRRVVIRDVMEGSTTLRVDRAPRPDSPLSVLWVGRLNANKDPLTVLRGFAAFAETRPDSTLTMVYGARDLEPAVKAAVAGTHGLRSRVTLLGEVPHADLAPIYAAADIFVLGSHREGSGYAVLEALACGVVPVVTNIPSFRSLTAGGRAGALWRPGDPVSLREALESVAARPFDPQRRACRDLFEEKFSWTAIGRRAVAIYREASRG